MIIGLVSTYLEGPTARHAIRTALQACDRVLVCEGPAGPPLDADVPETWRPDPHPGNLHWNSGRWRTDARKRTWMLDYAKRVWPEARWGLWLDGDEVLVNPEYLRDWTTLSDHRGDERLPLRLIELDGSVSITLVKLVRIDLIRSYTVSLANTTGPDGQAHSAGNFHDTMGRYLGVDRERAAKLEAGYLYVPPGPAPLDPYIVHRPLLRHPDRAGLRLNEQEAAEIAKLANDSG